MTSPQEHDPQETDPAAPPGNFTAAEPQGTLTAAQHEILTALWNSGPAGLTVAEIRQALEPARNVGRTTVLNLVDRLEKRGWLRRKAEGASFRYTAAVSRAWTESRLATGFVEEFFGGSAAHAVQSLLGSQKLSADDIDRLRRLLDDADHSPPAALDPGPDAGASR